MADYRNCIIQPANPTRGKHPRKTSSIQVLRKDDHHTLLKQFRFELYDDESLQRAIQRAKNYVDHVVDRGLREIAERNASKGAARPGPRKSPYVA